MLIYNKKGMQTINTLDMKCILKCTSFIMMKKKDFNKPINAINMTLMKSFVEHFVTMKY